ncbi:fimbrial protein [Xanthomonas campestris pv. badrii]|uniref:Fimbrial protein n=1 Tax=Xanthomonas campestris pv. badrii TaxID=149696 RepID=A0A7Z2V7F8_XANCA|nr:fimbrial protein [Xanthomonas campestris]MCC4605477.1 fimbrial protein [Xanthomonas campestris pv. parthenii]QJD66501.1 fimbrial protein [Xanthomonas campestris pv. badrii]
MKKIISSPPVLLMAVLCVSSTTAIAAPPPVVTVDGGTINFTGSIVNTACSIEVGSDDQTVSLGQVRADAFTAKGDRSTPVLFSVKLSDCALAKSATPDIDAYSNVALQFSGVTATTDNTVLGLSNSGDGGNANNIGIQILDGGVPVAVNGSAATPKHLLGEGENTLSFAAAYVATAPGVTAGSASAMANFKLIYE